MATATSATGGALFPGPQQEPLQDQTFEDFLQSIFVALSGLPGNVVFPRWQPEPPNLPNVGTDWAAFGITTQHPDTYAAILHDGSDEGSDEMQRHETVDTMISCYGPNNMRTASLFRDNLMVPQNQEVFTRNGMGLVDTGEMIFVPQLIKAQWLRRVDMRWTIRRAIWRRYPVLNLLSAQGFIDAVDVTETFNA